MKKIKIKKCMTSFLMLAVMVVSIIGIMPKTIAFASTFSYVQVESWRGENADKYTHMWSPVGGSDIKYYVAYSKDHTAIKFFAISKSESFKISSANMTNDVITDTSKYDYTGSVSVQGDMYYYFVYEYTYSAPTDNTNFYDFQYSGASGTCLYSETHTNAEFVKYFITGKFPDDCDFNTTMTSTTDGSADKPYKTDKLGTLVDMEKHYKSYVEMGNSDTGSIVNERTHHWGWNKKTSTGLNLLDNDSFDSIETYCYIKFYDVYKKNWITGSKEKLSTDKFKKLYFISKCDASKLKLEVKQTDVLNDEMIKELKSIGDSLGAYDLTHEMVYSYDFYFQLVGCKNGKYYKGGYVHFKKDGSVEEILGGKYDVTTNTADEDDNGNIKDNDDSETGTGVTGTGDNYDDAKNNADAVKNKTDDSSSGLDVASIKSFMKEVGNVPKAIGKLFSFLPNWVTTFIGFGFVVLIALIIIKAIRG